MAEWLIRDGVGAVAYAIGRMTIGQEGKVGAPRAIRMLMRSMMDVFASYERAVIHSRTRPALAVKRSRGERLGGDVPVGYRAEGARLVANETEQAIVNRVREMRAVYRSRGRRSQRGGRDDSWWSNPSHDPRPRAAPAIGRVTGRPAARRVKVTAWECTCQRCGHRWTAVGEDPPRACAGCKSQGWQEEARGRRPDVGRRRR